MFAFVVYAVAVWFLAAHWRRQWRGFGAVAAGFLGCVAVGYFHYRLSVWTHGRIYLAVLQVLLYPYSIMVTAVGLFIVSLPRAVHRFHCPNCHYNLAGLRLPGLICPECGTPFRAQLRVGRCGICRYELKGRIPTDGKCPACHVSLVATEHERVRG